MLDAAFTIANSGAVLGWGALLLFPRRYWVHWWLAGLALPIALAGLYLGLMAIHAPGASGGFGSLDEVASLFSNRGLLLAGWAHYLAFDLFIGAWMCRRATAEGRPLWRLYPALPLTFLAGPIGLLVFFLLGGRGFARRITP